MRMTAAVMHEQGLPMPYAKSNPFRIEEVELQAPGPGEVLVEVRAAGLCHSDLAQVAGAVKRPLPIVGGHEGAGIVRELGAGVSGFSPGDHAVLVNVTGCGACRYCRVSRPGLCQAVGLARGEGKLATGERRLQQTNGGLLNHWSGLSVFAQYAIVVPESIIKIDKSVPFDVAAMLGCGVMTGSGAVYNAAKVQPGESVAVVGLGGVGLSAVMAAREAGASIIIGIDVLPSKFDLARAVGCTHCIDARDPTAAQQVKDLTDGGVDHAFEISGVMPAVNMAHAIAARGGEVVHVGVSTTAAEFPVRQWPLVVEERVLRGTFMGSGVPKRDIPRLIDLYQRGEFPMDRLRSEYIGFDRLNESMDLLERGAVIRQILLPHGPNAAIAQ
jgi:Zn-dependent alcohol dehydrogenase